MTPEEQALIEALCEPGSSHSLLHEAISDPARCAQLSERASAWLQRQDPLTRALALHLTRALSLRSVALSLPPTLSMSWLGVPNPLWGRSLGRPSPMSDGVSAFAVQVPFHAYPTLAETALRGLFYLSPHAHPARAQGLSWGLSALNTEPLLITTLWEAWPAERSLLPLKPHLGDLLTQSPSEGRALAVRLALLHPDEALELCEALSELEEVNLGPLYEALHKQLLRVKRVRLWVECREALRRGALR